jgi:hypothetical protein
MTVFYASAHSETDRIMQDAHIAAFYSERDMCEYLEEMWLPKEWRTFRVLEGSFGDCWQRFHHEPTEADLVHLAPFTSLDDFFISPPGTHPGGPVWWVTPRATVYVGTADPIDD